MTASNLSRIFIALLLIGMIAVLRQDFRSVWRAGLDHESEKNLTTVGPWRETAPRLEVQDLPQWIKDYVAFHDHSLAEMNASSHRYMIYTCKKGHRCSGTGNRQRGIMAVFLVSIITKRIFLMDIDNPVPLHQILEPHLIKWHEIPENLLETMSQPLINIRNVQPNPLQVPSYYTTGPRIVRILASGPGGLETIWNSTEMQQLLPEFDENMPHVIYKWLFYTLFRPSLSLQELIQNQRSSLGLTKFSFSYIGVHVRLGGGGAWGGYHEQRYNETALPRFLQLGHQLQKSEHIPIVIISDDSNAKEILHNMDPESVRYVANVSLVHVDRSKHDDNSVDGSLQVWADIMLLAQATCLVESLSSFSSLARRISVAEDEPQRCSVRQDEGMLLTWTPYWKGQT